MSFLNSVPLRFTAVLLGAAALSLTFANPVQADSPGKNGVRAVATAGTIVNQSTTLASASAIGSTVITVANIANLVSPEITGGGALAAGDVVMLYQPRGANINTTNATTYGDITSYGGAGNYEMRSVASVSGNTIALASSLSGSACTVGLKNTYAAGSQVIRVPQYSALTVSAGASMTSSAWDGSLGGVVAVLVEGSLAVNGSVTVSGQGFRGGIVDATDGASGDVVAISFVSDAAAVGGAKGEGIASGAGGTFGVITLPYSNPGGNFDIGAAANGGGGGGTHNGGGGGGGNAAIGLTPYCTSGTSTYSTAFPTATVWCGQGAMPAGVTGASAWQLDPAYKANGNVLTTLVGGGRGGYTYNQNNSDALTVGPGDALWGGDRRRALGGWGGRPLAQALATRLFFGGGGGAGGNNNGTAGAGGAGGGIIIMEAGSLSGSGSITANGNNGATTTGTGNDAPGGAGAGGSIVLRAGSGSVGLVQASGGNGGLQVIATGESEGPGGGGGGGIVAISGAIGTQVAAGGSGGTTSGSSLTEFPRNGATDGSAGLTSQTAPTIRGTTAVCTNLSLLKNNNVTSLPAGGTTSYTLSVVNSGPGAADNAVLRDPPITGLSCSSVSCTTAIGGSVCPSGTSTTVAFLQGSGIALPSLPANSTLTFALNCGVTATGQ